MHHIDCYSFGRIEIDGKLFKNDIVILPEHINYNWWRDTSHRLKLSDIDEIVKFNPDIFIIGTGKFSLMKVNDAVKNYCKNNDTYLIIKRTDLAIKEYNKYRKEEKIAAAFHLTC